jgi:hypothetical protein
MLNADHDVPRCITLLLDDHEVQQHVREGAHGPEVTLSNNMCHPAAPLWHGELGGVERWEFPILHNCCKVRIGMWKTYFFASSEELRAWFPFGIIRLGVSSLQMLNFVGL